MVRTTVTHITQSFVTSVSIVARRYTSHTSQSADTNISSKHFNNSSDYNNKSNNKKRTIYSYQAIY